MSDKYYIMRRLKHFYKSGCIFHGIEHFLVMFPSALVIVTLTSNDYGEPIFNLSTVLIAVGIGTLVFIILTKGKIPFFLGPSFSYIGFTSYYVATISNAQNIQYVRSIIVWGYLLSGILILFISILYRFEIIKLIIDFLFPSAVMAPAISLIGLELANTAINDAGFTNTDSNSKILAILTLIVIIFASLTKRKFFKNTSVFIGILVGCTIASFMGMFDYKLLINNKLFIFPTINFHDFLVIPTNIFHLFIAIIPSSIVVFTEIMGRITVLEGMQKRDKIDNNDLTQKSLKSHSIANIFSVLLASIPLTFYAENLAVMNLNSVLMTNRGNKNQDEDHIVKTCYNPYSIYPYVIASILSILVACFGCLQNLFIAIPKAVLGAMELFIFTLIVSPGIQMLVDNKTDYKKISNQIITASVLLAGVSSLVIKYKTFNLKGMSLGLTIGLVLNLITKLLSHFGLLNENLILIEILEICIKQFSSKITLSIKGNAFFSEKKMSYNSSEIIERIHQKDIEEMLKMSHTIELTDETLNKKILIKQAYEQIRLIIALPLNLQSKYCNDYDFVIPIDEEGKVQIVINSSLSSHKLNEIIKYAI